MEHGLIYIAFAIAIFAVIYAATRPHQNAGNGGGQQPIVVFQQPAGGGQQQPAALTPQQNKQPVPAPGANNPAQMGNMMGNMGTPAPRGAIWGRQWNGIGADGIPYGGNYVEYDTDPGYGSGRGNGGGGVGDINIHLHGSSANADANTAHLAMPLHQAAGATPVKQPLPVKTAEPAKAVAALAKPAVATAKPAPVAKTKTKKTT